MMATSKSAEKRPSDQELVNKFNSMKSELSGIAQKIGELEQEKDEHKLVVDTMVPLEADRKCFRLIGGVLVERTVGDVLPTLKQNLDNVRLWSEESSLTRMNFLEFQKKYNIKIRDASEIGSN
ncbi:Prefoldin [Chytridium lagenaria]|nr:Prefoldin [Chytridium lagenaria]